MKNTKDILEFTWIKEYNINFLKYLAFWNKNSNFPLYTEIKIKKSNWKERSINIPNNKLKQIQRKILKDILEPYWDTKINKKIKVHNVWFQRWKSIIHNAKKHTWKDIIIKIDIKDYFPSINQSRIFWIFHKNLKFNYLVSSYLSWLCTYNDILPQWSPTSPILSNIVSKKIDLRISKYIDKIKNREKLQMDYSRYADDIIISINEKDYYKQINYIENISKRIFYIVQEEWFEINIEKYKIIKNNQKQKVTWIIVNKKISIWRKKFKWLKAIVNNINKGSWELEYEKWLQHWNESNNLENFKSKIKWYIAYYNMIDKYIYWKHLKLNK